jgi:endonuclease III-like uncharacterized protein
MIKLNRQTISAFGNELQKIAMDFDEQGNLVDHSLRNTILGIGGLGAATAGGILLHKKLTPKPTAWQKFSAGA